MDVFNDVVCSVLSQTCSSGKAGGIVGGLIDRSNGEGPLVATSNDEIENLLDGLIRVVKVCLVVEPGLQNISFAFKDKINGV